MNQPRLASPSPKDGKVLALPLWLGGLGQRHKPALQRPPAGWHAGRGTLGARGMPTGIAVHSWAPAEGQSPHRRSMAKMGLC